MTASTPTQWCRRHAAPLWCALFVVLSGMALSFLWFTIIGRGNGWATPGDLWGTFRDAHLVGWGGEADVYQSGTGYLSPPALPVLLAPVAMLAGALHLTESFPLSLQHPSAWLLLGPADLLCGSFVLFPVDAVARRLGLSRARRVGVLWMCAGLSIPLLWVWGHPEDLLALTCALYALLAAFDARWTKAAFLVGLGLAFQPLVALLVPLVVARIPWRQMPRAVATAVVPPGLLLAAPLVHAWRTTLHAVVDQPTFPAIGHATPWLALSPLLHGEHAQRVALSGTERLFTNSREVIAGGPERVPAVAVAIAIGIVVRRLRPSEAAVVWLAALCLSLRCVFESVMFPYYVVPALMLVMLASAAAPRRRHLLSVGAVALCASVAYADAAPWMYYLAVTAPLLGAWALAVTQPRRATQQRAGEPAGGGATLGSNGSRVAPQLGSVRGVLALPAVDDVVVVVAEAESVATVRAFGGVVAGAAEP